MKEEAILKINKVGKISTIVAIICKILLILGLVASAVGLIICLVLPKDLVKVTTSGTMKTEIDYGVLGVDAFAGELENVEEMEEWMSQGGDVQVTEVRNGVPAGGLNFKSSGQTYVPTSVSVEDGVVKVDMTSGEITVGMRDMAVLVLVYIFKYGAVLQQESDETL